MKRAVLFALKKTCALTIVIAALNFWAFPQTAEVHAKPITDADIQLLRQDVQAMKNQIITDTMSFNEKEAAAFWPLYKEYAAGQHSIADKRLAIITDYVKNLDKMDDAKAHDLTQRMFAIEEQTHTLRKQYSPRFEKALGAKRAAKFYQVDSRLGEMVDLQLASEVPLIP